MCIEYKKGKERKLTDNKSIGMYHNKRANNPRACPSNAKKTL